jgi:hypothetical protein
MTMNSNAAVFGICSAAAESGGYGSPQPYPTPEQLSAFYASGGGSGSGNGGDTPPLTYHGAGSGGLHPAESRTGGVVSGGVIETKYEPNPTSHSPTGGIIASDNGLQYANLDGSDIKGGGYAGGGGGGYGHPHHHAQYQAHHASLVQASYAHHYGTGEGGGLVKINQS